MITPMTNPNTIEGRLTKAERKMLAMIDSTEREHGTGLHLLFTLDHTDRVIARLERAGLVDATSDRRYAVLTPLGRAALTPANPSHEADDR